VAKQSIKIRCVDYSSITAAAKAFDLNPKLVQGRLNSGWELHEAFELIERPTRKPARRSPISVKTPQGVKEYSSIKEAALEYGLDPRVVRARLTTHGWSVEKALGLVPPDRRKAHNRKKVEFNLKGKKYTYESVSAAAKAMGLSEFLVFGRLNARGWTIEQALELVPPPAHTKTCYGYIYLVINLVNGKQYVGQTMRTVEDRWETHIQSAKKETQRGKHSLAQAILDFGISAFSIRQMDTASTHSDLNRLERYWIKKSNTLAPYGYNLNRGGSGVSKGQPVIVNGVKYCSISDAAREYNLKDRLVLDRLRYGWEIEQALELKPAPESHKYAGRSISLSVENKELTFESIGGLARYFNLSTAIVMQRIVKLNWTPEQAVGLVSKKWVHPMHAITLKISGEDRHFFSKADAAAQYGFNHWATVEKRISRDWSLEQALGIDAPPKNKFETKEVKVLIEGVEVTYSSQSEAARTHGISFKKISARRNLGWTYEEALEIVPRAQIK
jgi:hypothetical protein